MALVRNDDVQGKTAAQRAAEAYAQLAAINKKQGVTSPNLSAINGPVTNPAVNNPVGGAPQQAAGTSSGSVTTPGGLSGGQFPAVSKMTAQQLAEMYGVTYKRGDIEGILNEATAAKFNELDSQGRKLRDQQLTDYASQAGQMQQQFRQNRQNAMKNGMSRGMNAAQDIMSQAQVQQNGAQNQTFYQQGLADLVNQRGTQLGADKYNALAMSNEMGMGLGGLATTFHQTDTAGRTGDQQYDASIANTLATRYAADQNANAMRYSANINANSYGASGDVMTLAGTISSSLKIDQDLAYDVASGKLSAEDAMKAQRSRTSQAGSFNMQAPGVAGMPVGEDYFKNGGF